MNQQTQSAAWRRNIRDELFRMYVKNHKAAALFMIAPYLLVAVAYYYFYGMPTGATLDIVCISIILAAAAAAAQQLAYTCILQKKFLKTRLSQISVICLTKAVSIGFFLTALFYPIDNHLFSSHFLGYFVVLFSIIFYPSISAVYFPLLIFEIGLTLLYTGFVIHENIHVRETQFVIPVLAAATLLALVTGRQMYQNG